MSVFISYSHDDAEFVDRLVAELVGARVPVWLDRWEMNVGESLTQKIQAAIEHASQLLVVFSNSSLASRWCGRELNAGLVRELEENRVVVLPILAEACELPLFLRDKYYADFTRGFEEGMGLLRRSLARYLSDTLGREEGRECSIDYRLDWGIADGRLRIQAEAVNIYPAEPYSILTSIDAKGNAAATRHFQELATGGAGRTAVDTFLLVCHEIAKSNDLRMYLDGDRISERGLTIADSSSDRSFDMTVRARRLGDDSGMNILFDAEGVFRALAASVQKHSPRL